MVDVLYLQQDWPHYAGESERLIVMIDLSDPTVNLATAVSRLAINEDMEQSTPTLQFTGTVENSAKGWRAIIPVNKGATSGLLARDYMYQVEIETASDLRVIAAGKMVVKSRLGSTP